MKKLCLAILFLLAGAAPAAAATYWISPGGGAATCAAASGSSDPGQYRTTTQGMACLSPGDTLMIKMGDYGTNGSGNGGLFNMPGGLSNSQRTIIMTEDAPGQARFLTGGPAPDCSGDLITPGSHNWITFKGNASRNLVFDGRYVGGCGENVIAMVGGQRGIRFENVEITGAAAQGIFQGDSSDMEYINLHVHHNGFGVNQTGCDIVPTNGLTGETPGLCHGLYLSQGDNNLIDGGEYHDSDGWNIQVCCQAPTNVTIRNTRNYRAGRGGAGGNGIGVVQAGGAGGHKVHDNFVFETFGRGIMLASANTAVFKNTVYGNSGDGIGDSPENAGSTDVFVRDNISIGNGGTNILLCTGPGLRNGSPEPNCTSAATQSNNSDTGSASSFFVDAAGRDFTLLSTATAAINTGIAVISPSISIPACSQSIITNCYNGPAPDRGAYETGSAAAEGPPNLTANPSSPLVNTVVLVTVDDDDINERAEHPGDWVGMFPASANLDGLVNRLDWFYMNGTKTTTVALSDAVLPFTAPASPGGYVFRFYRNNSTAAADMLRSVSFTVIQPAVVIKLKLTGMKYNSGSIVKFGVP